MDCCRNEMGLFRPDSRRERHEWVRLAYLEIVGRMLREHGRCERAERFAILDPRVNEITHLAPQRRGED